MESQNLTLYKTLLDSLLRAQAEKNPNFEEMYNNILEIITRTNLSVSSEINLVDITENLAKISKLLSLDVKNTIDYNSITDKITRHQLRLDNLAMARVRFGLKQTASGVIFDDYCRYAHYQSEELINYFYAKKFADAPATQRFIMSNNKSYRENLASRTIANRITDISYQYKLFTFNQVFPFREYWTIQSISYIRNQASHRCSIIGDKEDELMCDYEIKQLGRRFRKDLSYNDQQLYDKCEKIIFRRDADFDKVSIALTALYQKVISNLP